MLSSRRPRARPHFHQALGYIRIRVRIRVTVTVTSHGYGYGYSWSQAKVFVLALSPMRDSTVIPMRDSTVIPMRDSTVIPILDPMHAPYPPPCMPRDSTVILIVSLANTSFSFRGGSRRDYNPDPYPRPRSGPRRNPSHEGCGGTVWHRKRLHGRGPTPPGG